MSQLVECIVKLLVASIALIALIALSRGRPAFFVQHRSRILQGLTLLGALAYINFGGLHTDGTAWHLWDQYHYFVGSKYFPELKYDGLYVATIQARRETHPELPPPARVRDLRSGELVPLASVADHTAQVRSRFSDDRWQQFSADVSRFYLRDDIFLDNGLKATPTHIQVLRLFSSWQPFRTRSIALVAMLDFLLLGIGGYAVYRAFGLTTLAGVSLAFGIGFCSRYYWLGGAFLRHDWLVALLLAAACLQLGHIKSAAAAVAYASMVRIFPVLFVLPLVVYWLAKYRSGHSIRPLVAFSSVFALSAVSLFAVGWLGQPDAWPQSISGLITHARTNFPNSVGLRIPFITGFANLHGDLVNPSTLYDYVDISRDYARLLSARLWLVILVTAIFVGLTLRAAWRAPTPAAAFVLGIALVFALTAPTCYYGTFFALLPLVRPVRSTAVFLGASICCYIAAALVLALSNAGYLRLNGAAVFAPVSLFLAIALVDWLLHYPRQTAPIANHRPGDTHGDAIGDATLDRLGNLHGNATRYADPI